MEEYFKPKINHLNRKVESWNSKNIFQRLFSKEKWSEEKSYEEIEKMFSLKSLDQIKSNDDFNVYLKYFTEYSKALPDDLSIKIVERLLISSFINPKVETLLQHFLEANKARQYHNKRAMDLINSIK